MSYAIAYRQGGKRVDTSALKARTSLSKGMTCPTDKWLRKCSRKRASTLSLIALFNSEAQLPGGPQSRRNQFNPA